MCTKGTPPLVDWVQKIRKEGLHGVYKYSSWKSGDPSLRSFVTGLRVSCFYSFTGAVKGRVEGYRH